MFGAEHARMAYRLERFEWSETLPASPASISAGSNLVRGVSRASLSFGQIPLQSKGHVSSAINTRI